MREILFRGKREDNGEWVEGDLFHNDDVRFPITCIGCLVLSKGKYTDVLDIDGQEIYEVIPETVGQYTGRNFKDKKCFTGDIIFARNSRMLVDFDEDYLAYWTYYFDETGNKRKYSPLSDIAGYECWGIIGNIHDNPELLEVKE